MTSHFVSVPVVALTLVALILSCLTSISLPKMDSIAIAQTVFSNGSQVTVQTNGTNISNGTSIERIDEIKFGIWTACVYNQDEKTRLCNINATYNIVIVEANHTVTHLIDSPISHALAFEPVCTGFILAAFLFSFSVREKYVAIAFWFSASATILGLIFLGLNIGVLMLVHKGMSKLPSHSQTLPGIGFYLSIGVVVLIGLAAIVAFLGRNSGFKRLLLSGVPLKNV